MEGTPDDSETTVDVFLRADGPATWRQQHRVIDHLDRLDESDVIDRYGVQVWGEVAPLAGPLSETRYHRSAVRKVAEFEEWAESMDRPVELPFERDEVTSEFTGECHRLVRLPVTCLAVYEGAELVAVYPCVEDGRNCPVEAVLDRMAAALRTDAGADPAEILPGLRKEPG